MADRRSYIMFPDDATCTTRFAYGDLWECLVENAKNCPFNLSYGAEYYCMHKDCSSFACDEGAAGLAGA